MSRRVLEPAPDVESGLEEFVLPQLVGRALLTTPRGRKDRKDSVYDRTEQFWADVLSERLVAERVVTLTAVRLFEWFPRNPGLFHTTRGFDAREQARYHIMDLDQSDYLRYMLNTDAAPDHAKVVDEITGSIRELTKSGGAARTKIFTPKGKISMVQGGIGCVRYKSVDKKAGGKAWFMSATSTLAPDEGVPLLVPDDIYQELIDRIRREGFSAVTILGRVRFISDEFRDVYSTKHGIPRLYIDVEEVKCLTQADKDYGIVSVAASFVAEVDGEAGIYAAYVTFDPGYIGARASAIDWMKEEYVRGLYQGEMLTDFDQQSPSVSDTLFSLEDVMTSPDLATVVYRLRKQYGHFDWSMLERQSINFSVDRRDMRMEVHIGGNATNVVIGGQGSSNSLVINQHQLQQLSHELGRAKQVLKDEPETDDRDRIIGALADAEAAAKDVNQEGITSALKRLKPFKDKVISILEKVGVEMTIAAIKAAAGLQG